MSHRYHINNKGDVGLCKAEHACPFGDIEADHFPTSEEARFAYEARNNAFTFKPQNLKNLTHDDLVDGILTESGLKGKELQDLEDSIELAEVLHQGATRKAIIQGRANTPYIEHPLRNTLRLIRMGVKDPATLMAAVLHDTVEDCSKRYVELYTDHDENQVSEPVARDLLFGYIGRRFGRRTSTIVEGMTNPYNPDDEWRKKTPQEKRDQYRVNVKAEISDDPDVFLGKVSDFIDNAGSLHHATPEEKKGARRLALKYYPVVPDFQEAFEKHKSNLKVSPEGLQDIARKLEHINRRLRFILSEKQ